MKRKWKTGILLATLAIPVFIWIFLKYFGQNSFALPIYYLNGIDSLSDCANGQQPHTLPSFSLKNTSGDTLTSSNFDGEIMISYFLPQRCTDSCELVLERLAGIQNTFVGQDDLRIVVFGNKQYSLADLISLEQRFNANPKVWNFATGEEEVIKRLKKCGFVLSSIPEYSLVVTDAKRRIRGYYQAVDDEEIDRLKGEMKILDYMQDEDNHD